MARAPVVPLVVVWLSLIFALCLQVMPLADGWQVFRPEWIGLMLIYWCIRWNHRSPYVIISKAKLGLTLFLYQ